jgi:hypothetical protein
MSKGIRIYNWFIGIWGTILTSLLIMGSMMKEIFDKEYKPSTLYILFVTFVFTYYVFKLAYMINYSINSKDEEEK